jgi:hypothetical protein
LPKGKPRRPQVDSKVACTLEQSPLFNLRSEKRLAKLLLCSSSELRQILKADEQTRFRTSPCTQTKRVYDPCAKRLVGKAKIRDLQIPTGITQRIHRRLYTLLNRLTKPEYLHSGVRGRSYVTSARLHVGTLAMAKADIKSFFPSVRQTDIYQFFAVRLQCAPDIAGRLAKLCSFQERLPTGSPLSQILAFLAFQPMFDEIAAMARSAGLRLTLYVDDIVVSGPKAGRGFLYEIRRVVCRHGLKIHKLRSWTGGSGYATGAVVTARGLRLPNLRRLIIHEDLARLQKLRDKLSACASKRRERLLRRLIGRCWEATQFDESFRDLALQLTSELRRIRRRHDVPARPSTKHTPRPPRISTSQPHSPQPHSHEPLLRGTARFGPAT